MPGRVRSATRATGAALVAVVALTACGSAVKNSATKPSLVSIGAGLRGPAGVTATVYATGLELMSAFAFDKQGRLWVTTSGSSTHGTDGLYVVAKRGATPTRIAARLRGPLGLVWLGSKLYVSSLGRVEVFALLTGTRREGTHFASRRTVLVGPKGSGENNNLIESPTGELVLGVSAPCDHCTPSSPYSGSIVEFKPDGTGLHLVARRVRAPYGLVFYPGTDRLIATLNQRDDLGAKTPGDWLALVAPGSSFGWPQCYGQAGSACDGVPRPLAVLEKHAAAGGVAIVEEQLGQALGPSAVVAEWALGRVLRVPLEARGTHGRAAVPFLTGFKHPLPVAIAPDGGLLVGDWSTGTIYRIADS